MKKNQILSLAILTLLILPVIALADADPETTATATEAVSRLSNPLHTNDIREVIGNIIRSLLGLSGALALLMFVWGGLQWVTSGGDPQKITKGKNTLIWATFGLVIIFGSYTAVAAILNALTSGSIG